MPDDVMLTSVVCPVALAVVIMLVGALARYTLGSGAVQVFPWLGPGNGILSFFFFFLLCKCGGHHLLCSPGAWPACIVDVTRQYDVIGHEVR